MHCHSETTPSRGEAGAARIGSLATLALATLAVAVGAAVLFALWGPGWGPGPAGFTNSIGLDMVEIPAGSFQMGSIDDASQMPVHEVVIAKPFFISATVVTQQQWEDVMGTRPWVGEGLYSATVADPKKPAINMVFREALEFCRRLTEKEGRHYRLPSEAEWEYAARGGGKGRWCFGDNAGLLEQYAWYSHNSRKDGQMGARPVALLKPNAFGLFDAHGNVWEFCLDHWQSDYKGAPADGSPWLQGGYDSDHVMRGGSYHSIPERATSTVRYNIVPTRPYENVGFRVASDSQG